MLTAGLQYGMCGALLAIRCSDHHWMYGSSVTLKAVIMITAFRSLATVMSAWSLSATVEISQVLSEVSRTA